MSRETHPLIKFAVRDSHVGAYLRRLPSLLRDGHEGKYALFGGDHLWLVDIGKRKDMEAKGYQEYGENFLNQEVRRDLLPEGRIARYCFMHFPTWLQNHIPLDQFYRPVRRPALEFPEIKPVT